MATARRTDAVAVRRKKKLGWSLSRVGHLARLARFPRSKRIHAYSNVPEDDERCAERRASFVHPPNPLIHRERERERELCQRIYLMPRRVRVLDNVTVRNNSAYSSARKLPYTACKSEGAGRLSLLSPIQPPQPRPFGDFASNKPTSAQFRRPRELPSVIVVPFDLTAIRRDKIRRADEATAANFTSRVVSHRVIAGVPEEEVERENDDIAGE